MALVPGVIPGLLKAGYKVLVQAGAGDYVLAAAPGSQAQIPGTANAFSRSGNTWSADGSTSIAGSTSFDPGSISVAASDDGNTYLVGADSVNSNAPVMSG